MGGMIFSIAVTNAGIGYTTNPIVIISDTTGSGAGAIASINTEVAMVLAIRIRRQTRIGRPAGQRTEEMVACRIRPPWARR